MASVTMPQLGETVVEGTILKWLKSEGERVELDEPLFEISTDKVDTEVPSPEAGVLTKILVPEGETVSVGTELARIDAGDAAGTGGEEAAAAPAIGEPAGANTTAAPAEQPATTTDQPTPPVEEPGAPPARPDAEVAASAQVPAVTSAGTLPDRGPRSQILSPLVRRLADEYEVDLASVVGTGTGGRITKQDVIAFVESGGAAPATPPGPEPAAPVAMPAEAPAQPPVPAAAPTAEAPAPAAEAPARIEAGEGEEVVPLSHLRKAIGEHMIASLRTSARAWTLVEVDMEGIVRLRERAKRPFAEREGFKLTYMPFVTRAVIDALLAFPMVNAELRGEEMVIHHYVNMGIAVSIEGGLIVPVIKAAESMNLVGLARSINDIANRARGKELRPDEVHGSTFTITNPGPYGSTMSVPIISQPNAGILSFDAIQQRPVVIDEAIAIRHMVNLSMSWDHRTIDGALATQFLARVKHNLETWDFAEEIGD